MEWNLIRPLWFDGRGLSPLAGLTNQVRPLPFPTAIAVGHNLSALTGLRKDRPHGKDFVSEFLIQDTKQLCERSPVGRFANHMPGAGIKREYDQKYECGEAGQYENLEEWAWDAKSNCGRVGLAVTSATPDITP